MNLLQTAITKLYRNTYSVWNSISNESNNAATNPNIVGLHNQNKQNASSLKNMNVIWRQILSINN